MKITNVLTKTAVLTVCLSSTIVAVAGSGNGKAGKNVMDALSKNSKAIQNIGQSVAVPRSHRGINQRFSFSAKTKANIRAGIDAGRLESVIDHAALEYSPVPAPILLGHTPTDATFSLQQMISAFPVEKEILASNFEEQQFYAKEIESATELYHFASNVETLDEETINILATSVLQDLKNHALQIYLLQSLAKKDLYRFKLDLAEYFNLNKPVEIAAFNYTLRHPHQQILMMRRLLNNPLVDEKHKEALRAFLQKSHIKSAEFPAFQTAISNVYSQYRERLAVASESDIIQTQVNYLVQLIDRLGDFIATSPNHRRPKWNTTSHKELQLFNEIEWVQIHQYNNKLEPLLSYQKALNLVWERAEPTYLTLQETLDLFEEFVKVTKRRYPYSLRTKFKPGEIPFYREEELWDNLTHWEITNPGVFFELSQIYNRVMGSLSQAQ